MAGDARRSAGLVGELITAIYESAVSGQRVALPIPKDHPRYGGWQAEPGAFGRPFEHGAS